MNSKRIVVVGGGPAGIMAAIKASQLAKDVTLIEKNPTLGKKLLLSGKGRCNLTNAGELGSFLKRFPKNGQFLRDAFKHFFNRDLMDFFEKRGLRLRIERQDRVFPVTDRSNSVLDVLKRELQKNKVDIAYKTEIKEVLVKQGEVGGVTTTGKKIIPTTRLILATGGVSYSFTGSTGEGIKIAQSLGHGVSPLRPGLVPLEIKERYPRLLEGLTLKNICLKFSNGKKEIFSEIGELLFTGFGISGPLVLSLSGQIVDWLEAREKVYVEIDLKPALSKEKLDLRLLRELNANSKKSIKNILGDLLPRRMVSVFIDIAKIDSNKKASQVTQKERRDLVSLFKGLRLDIMRARPIEEAMVTKGGVSLKDINPRTMESRLIRGLYFAGEMIDVHADTGGFNLQTAFSTGYLAGESAALK